MKNTLLLLIFIGGFIFNSQAQRPEYDDLVTYFADGEYEKLMKKAYKYTQGDKTKKDALPYYYLSIANYKISKGHDLLEKYPKAIKEAYKYSAKCIQKDKDGTIVAANLDHFNNLKKDVIENITNVLDDENYKRLLASLSLMSKVDKNDIGTNFLRATAYYYKEDPDNVDKFVLKAEELLANVSEDAFTINEDDSFDITNKKKNDRETLKLGVIQYSRTLVLEGKKSEAKKLVGKVAQWFPEDKEFKAEYDKLFN